VTLLLVLGICLALAAPLLRRFHKDSLALAGGASTIIVLSIVERLHEDPRIGLSAIESNRHFYYLFLACEVPVLLLALISWRKFKSAFWLGWAINLVLALYLTVITIWLEFFWHW
jgi:hypothetical protein